MFLWLVILIFLVIVVGLDSANEPSESVVKPSESSAIMVTEVLTAFATSRNPAPARDSGYTKPSSLLIGVAVFRSRALIPAALQFGHACNTSAAAPET